MRATSVGRLFACLLCLVRVRQADSLCQRPLLTTAASAANIDLQALIDNAYSASDCTAGEIIYIAVPTSVEFDFSAQVTIGSGKKVYVYSDTDGIKSTLDGQGLTRLFQVQNGGQLELNDLILKRGTGVEGGAVMVDNGGALAVSSSTFEYNNASSGGGGAVANLGTSSFVKSVFQYNSANHDSIDDHGGGALANDPGGVMTITGCQFLTNEASYLGAAIFVDENSVSTTLDSSYFDHGNHVLQGFTQGDIFNGGTLDRLSCGDVPSSCSCTNVHVFGLSVGTCTSCDCSAASPTATFCLTSNRTIGGAMYATTGDMLTATVTASEPIVYASTVATCANGNITLSSQVSSNYAVGMNQGAGRTATATYSITATDAALSTLDNCSVVVTDVDGSSATATEDSSCQVILDTTAPEADRCTVIDGGVTYLVIDALEPITVSSISCVLSDNSTMSFSVSAGSLGGGETDFTASPSTTTGLSTTSCTMSIVDKLGNVNNAANGVITGCTFPGLYVDCVGQWGACGTDCKQTWTISQAAQNGGGACAYATSDFIYCNVGTDNCAGVQCDGSYDGDMTGLGFTADCSSAVNDGNVCSITLNEPNYYAGGQIRCEGNGQYTATAASPTGVCPEHASSWPTCTCNPGYQLEAPGNVATCVDVYCLVDHYVLSHVCTACATGYNNTAGDRAPGSDTQCEDINECLWGGNTCHVEATCANTAGSYTCTCNQGYQGDGVSCEVFNCTTPTGFPENFTNVLETEIMAPSKFFDVTAECYKGYGRSDNGCVGSSAGAYTCMAIIEPCTAHGEPWTYSGCECEAPLELSLYDSFGDGWNGATMSVAECSTGVQLRTGLAVADGEAVYSEQVCWPADDYSLTISSTRFDSEVSFTVTDVTTGDQWSDSGSGTFSGGCGGGTATSAASLTRAGATALLFSLAHSLLSMRA